MLIGEKKCVQIVLYADLLQNSCTGLYMHTDLNNLKKMYLVSMFGEFTVLPQIVLLKQNSDIR